MALTDMLSAIRELVLDEPVMEADSASRQKLLADRFPGLDTTEVADLAAVEPDRLAIYTNLIYAGQRATLQWIFPATFAVIHQLRDQLGFDEDPNQADFELTQDLQHRVPWASSSTRQLARNFQQYIREYRSDWVEAWSGLNDLVDYERIDLDLFYAQDVPHTECGSKDFQQVLDVEVSELLGLRLFRPEYVVVCDYKHNPHAVATAYKAHDALPDLQGDFGPVCLAGGRDIDTLMPRWVVLPPAVREMVRAAGDATPVAVNDLADAYVGALGPDHGLSEEQCFVEFFGHLQSCLVAGIFLRPE